MVMITRQQDLKQPQVVKMIVHLIKNVVFGLLINYIQSAIWKQNMLQIQGIKMILQFLGLKHAQVNIKLFNFKALKD